MNANRVTCHPSASSHSSDATGVVFIVDDDESVRESLPDLLRELGYDAEAFSSAEQFLASGRIGTTQCLILDFAMPGMSGLDLQQELASRGHDVPIVFITAHSDRNVRHLVIGRGAIECLFKPFSESDLREALHAACRAGAGGAQP